MDSHGLVTIMHVDVEGSTALATRVGDEAARRIQTQTKRIVRERVEAFGGREIDAVGDAMMMTFGSTRAAIAGATGVQEALAARERDSTEDTQRVRIGLNVGEVLERDGAPFGAAVNAGARIMAKADGGEILVSEMVRQLAGTVPGVEYRDRGRHNFKGFDEPWRLYEVVWPGAPAKRSKPSADFPRRRLALAAAGFVLVIAAALVALIATREPGGGLRAIPPNTVGVIDARTNRIVATVVVGIRPGPVAVGGGSVWVGNLDDHNVTRINEARRTESATIPLDDRTPSALAYGGGALWVAHGALGQLSRVDIQFNRVARTVDATAKPPGASDAGVTVGTGMVWAVYHDSTLVSVEPVATRVAQRTTTDGAAPVSVVVSDGVVWVANSEGATVDRFNAETFVAGPLARSVSVGNQPVAIVAGAGAIWVACEADDSVTRIDSSTGATSTIPVGDGPTAIAVGAGAVWVANTAGRTVDRINTATNRVVRTIKLGAAPSGIAVSGGFVWVAAQAP